MSTKDNHAPTSSLTPTPANKSDQTGAPQQRGSAKTPAVAPSREPAKKKRRGEYGKSYVKIALIATISVLVCIQIAGML